MKRTKKNYKRFKELNNCPHSFDKISLFCLFIEDSDLGHVSKDEMYWAYRWKTFQHGNLLNTLIDIERDLSDLKTIGGDLIYQSKVLNKIVEDVKEKN